MSKESGFPFHVAILSDAESALWNTDRATWLGPFNAAQATEIWFRVAQYKLTLTPTPSVIVTPWVWDNTLTPPSYQPGTPINVEEFPAGGILLDMQPLNPAFSTAPANEQDLQVEQGHIGDPQLLFLANQTTANLIFAVSMNLFFAPGLNGPNVFDDTGAELRPSSGSRLYQLVLDSSGNYYMKSTLSGTVDLRPDGAYTPVQTITDATVYLGSDTVYTYDQVPLSVSCEFKSPNTALDIPGPDGLIQPSKYWSYDGIWNETTGAHN
jgi:hypothetical protein